MINFFGRQKMKANKRLDKQIKKFDVEVIELSKNLHKILNDINSIKRTKIDNPEFTLQCILQYIKPIASVTTKQVQVRWPTTNPDLIQGRINLAKKILEIIQA